MIHLQCACGASLQVLELYAGGHVRCHACGASVSIPADSAADEKFRFQCPHCATRIVARKTSAGKKSQCPACENIYVVPDPPAEPDASPSKDSRRIEIGTDDLALRLGLPFPVGKLEPTPVAPPQPRYLHSPLAQSNDVHPSELSTPTLILPKEHSAGSQGREQPRDELSPSGIADAEHDGSESTTVTLNLHPREAAQMGEWPRIEVSSPQVGQSSSAPTAAAIPNMTLSAKPASVGELVVLSGDCSGQRIRLDFHHFLVGAERDCDLRPASPLLSRHHCVFKKDEYSLRIRDLGSTNGTFVNGRRIFREAILKPGDEVAIADVTMQVFLPRSPQVIHSAPDSAPSISDFVIL